MLVRYWNPWREIETLHRQLDDVFGISPANNPETPIWQPAIELNDTGDQLVLRVQLPGIKVEDLDVQVSRKSVSLSAEHRYEAQADQNGRVRSEFRYGQFQRVVPLPVAVENEQVQADYTNGLLTLTLPKVAEARNTIVKVNLGKASEATNSANAETAVAEEQAETSA